MASCMLLVLRFARQGVRHVQYTPLRYRSTDSHLRSRPPRRTRFVDKTPPPPPELHGPPKPTPTSRIRKMVYTEAHALPTNTAFIARLGGFGIVPMVLRIVLQQPGLVCDDLSALWRAMLEKWSLAVQKGSPDALVFAPWSTIAADFDGAGKSAIQRACMQTFLLWTTTMLRRASARRGTHAVVALQSALRQLELLRSMADMRVPEHAYMPARTLTRQIHMHVGPTNSGKTHGALVALSRARTGLYAGPLRLLAHEVWERLNEGTIAPEIPPRACNLRTGEEQRIVDPLAGLVSCTVEMTDPNGSYDVAVIDEIQMLADLQRGPAWTQAVLGLPAKELHLCGEASAVPLARRLADLCGDVLHVHTYERLTPLSVAPTSLEGNLAQIQRGDCIVAFSRNAIFQLKRQIETQTSLQCAVAYGNLPPETKSEQAKLFNAGKLDVMVASDAIGMGLNLKIKRVIFDALAKWNGAEMVSLSVSQIKQIAGRAGRYGTLRDAQGGLVLTRYARDMPLLRAALDAPTLPLVRAALQPPSGMLESLALLLPFSGNGGADRSARSLSELYQDMTLLAQIEPGTFAFANFDAQSALAPILELRGRNMLTHAEKERWANAPVNLRDERAVAWFGNAVELYARGELIPFERCARFLGTLEAEQQVTGAMCAAQARRDEARRGGGQVLPLEAYTHANDADILTVDTLMLLESHHRALSLYLWLSFRFPLAFCFREDVEKRKAGTEKAIEFCLDAIRIQRARRLTKLGRADQVGAAQRAVLQV
ncbi:RNA helicase [Malassezia vespertilionis]|uniref:RNA helicase n=1 Tax=Malassezia vespertilionis TaxID=2020962 RepID=A0A2N1JBN2_9BASI|nr:RNA helicase [Malassezia vespertilionis]PKI83959.1 Suv3p [Malassezia vespertilionis]WFD06613.1 RNA helicase [Malassezia vespertilionis]